MEIVVARYNESLEWVDHPQLAECTKTIYNKGEAILAADKCSAWRVIDIPNIGRESNTYLHHIVTRYESLADVTLFFQGSINDRPEQELLPLPSYTSITPWGFAGKLDTCFEGHDWGRELDYISGISELGLCFGDFIQSQIDLPWRNKAMFVKGACFSVGKERIRLRPKQYYLSLLESVFLRHVNPREGHYMERAWFRMLTETR
jgi:hypothetical protein